MLLKNQVQDNTEVVNHLPIYVLCRRGIDSQVAVQKLNSAGLYDVKNIKGGLVAWSKEVDKNFPIY